MPAAKLPVVEIVRADVPELFAIEGGLSAHVAPLGNPVHERATVPLNPKAGDTVTVAVAELPAVTGAGDKALASTPKPGEVVLSITAMPVPGETSVGEKTISGRPSPFMSAIKAMVDVIPAPKIGRRPLVGKSISGPNVPSPFPNMIPVFCA